MASPAQTLTDADIAKNETSLPILSDADIAKQEHTNQPDPGYLGTLWNDLKSLPAGAYQLVRHPIDTTKAAIGQMDLEHPENSSGLLGLPDELYKEWQAGHKGEVMARMTELGLPIIFKGAGLAAEGAAGAAGKALDVVTSPAARDVAGIVSPRAAHMLSLATRVRRAFDAFNADSASAPAAATAPAEDMTVLDALAQSQAGKKFSKLGSADQQTIRDLAAKLNQPRPAAQPPIAPQAAPQSPAPVASSAPGETIFDIAKRELNQSEQPASPAAAAAPPAPAKPSLAQTEARMAQKSPAPTEAPQSQYTATGERKSPELRAMEIQNANRLAKAQRFAQALHAQGIDPKDIMGIPAGRFSDSQISAGAMPGWGNIADLLGEKMPSADTIHAIQQEMARLQKASSAVGKNPNALKIAEQLRDQLGQ